MTLLPGATVGRYQILEPLGQGGMATVYKAYQPSLDREVALKVLRPGYAQDQEFLERFEREAKSIAKLRHPHIVQVFDFEVSEGQYALAMEFLEGGTLKGRLAALAAQGKGLEPSETARIVSEVADALSYAHELGIVHRDIKPSNVMLTRKDRAVVTDFGIARILGATSHTQTGVGIGTPEYMAPEQGQGGAIDHRADIYSLGAMAYELLVGRVPYLADTPLAIVLAHMKDPLPLPSAINPSIGPASERVLLRALAKDPAQRFPAATDFAEALRDSLAEDASGGTVPTIVVRHGAPFVAAAATPPPASLTLTVPPLLRQRPILAAGAVAALLLVLGGGAAVLGVFRGPQATPAPAAPTAAPVTSPITVVTPAPATPSTASPKFAIPPKGRLLFEAKLDGTPADMNLFVQGDAKANLARGSIEFALGKESGSVKGEFKMPARLTYVGELDLAVTTTSPDVSVFWWLRIRPGGQETYQVFMFSDSRRGSNLNYQNQATGDSEVIDKEFALPDMGNGKPFTIAAVVEEKRITIFVNQRQVAQGPADRLSASGGPGIFASGSAGTVRLLGARFYELPAAATPAPQGELPPAPTGTGAASIATAPPGAPQATAPATPAPTRAVAPPPTPAPTPIPTPKFAIPAKGALYYEARLDGSSADLQRSYVPSGADADTEFRFVPGAIEMIVRKPGSARGANFNAPSRGIYVGEIELSAAPNADGFVRWVLRDCGATAGHIALNIQTGGEEMELDDWVRSADSHTSLTQTIYLTGLQRGRVFVIAAVTEAAQITVFVDQKQVARVPYTRCVSVSRAAISWGAGDQQSGGTVRVVGARFYELP